MGERRGQLVQGPELTWPGPWLACLHLGSPVAEPAPRPVSQLSRQLTWGSCAVGAGFGVLCEHSTAGVGLGSEPLGNREAPVHGGLSLAPALGVGAGAAGPGRSQGSQ